MTTLLDFTIKSTALLGAGLALMPLLGRTSASSRHAVWTSLFCAVALLPLASTALPPLPIPVFAAPSSPTFIEFRQAPVDRAAPPVLSGSAPRPSVTSVIERKGRVIRFDRVVVGFWLFGVCAFMIRMIAGAVGVWRLGRRAQPTTNAAVKARVERARRLLGVRREIVVLAIADEVMPVTWGLWRPVILLPTSAERSQRPDGIDAVILHEVAHIARLDVLPLLVAQLVAASLWFHPLAWMAHRAARLERERACDDAVLRLGARPSDYALELLMLVRALRPFGAMVLGTLGAAGRSHLDRRIRDILDARVNRRGASMATVVMAVALVAASAPVAAMRLTERPAPPPAVVHVADAPSSKLALTVEPMVTVRNAPQLKPRIAAQAITAQATAQAEIPWHAERGAMFQQLVDLTSQLIDNCKAQIQIGTLAPIDVRQPQATFDTVQARARQAAVSQTEPPSPVQRTEIRARFTDALQVLSLDTTRFSVGLLTLERFDADILAAADVLSGASASQSVPLVSLKGGAQRVAVSVGQSVRLALPFDVRRITVTNPSIADATGVNARELRIDAKAPGLISLIVWGDAVRAQYDIEVRPVIRTVEELSRELQSALDEPTDRDRAEAFLALARGTIADPFTPEMVTRFVDAVSRLSPAERDRVLAEPIRVKPAGGG